MNMLISTTNPEIGVMTQECPTSMCTMPHSKLFDQSKALNDKVYDSDTKHRYDIFKFDDHPMSEYAFFGK